ncbi:MAG: glutamate formimidoyltransferase [candidate division WOR-3 bacterium]
MKFIAAVPNFSEGRRLDIVDEIANAMAKTPGVKLLAKESDPSHNRSVITIGGDPDSVLEACIIGVKKAVELIDLTKHKGEHPRIGACDVLPFVPFGTSTMDDAKALAEQAGKIIAEELGIPVYFYEESARRPERVDLAYIRNRQFETVRDKVAEDPDLEPDLGPKQLHPTAGAVMVGARKPLIAFNVNLGTTNVEIAKEIAKHLRSKTGGLAFVKALGFELKDRNLVQVSMNMTDYTQTPLFVAYENVRMWAERFSVPIVGSEIVGLTPAKALYDAAEFYMKLENFSEDLILEKKLSEGETLEGYISSLAAATPAPGGGAAAGFSAAQGFALIAMVSGITTKSKKYAEHHELMRKVRSEARDKMAEALYLMREDEEAFANLMACYKIPKEEPGRAEKIQEAVKRATEVPLRSMRLVFSGLELADAINKYGTQQAVSDAAAATLQLRAAFFGAKLNVLINAPSIKDEDFKAKVLAEVEEMERAFVAKADEIYAEVEAKLKGKG